MKFEFPLDPSSGDEEGDPAPFVRVTFRAMLSDKFSNTV